MAQRGPVLHTNQTIGPLSEKYVAPSTQEELINERHYQRHGLSPSSSTIHKKVSKTQAKCVQLGIQPPSPAIPLWGIGTSLGILPKRSIAVQKPEEDGGSSACMMKDLVDVIDGPIPLQKMDRGQVNVQSTKKHLKTKRPGLAKDLSFRPSSPSEGNKVVYLPKEVAGLLARQNLNPYLSPIVPALPDVQKLRTAKPKAQKGMDTGGNARKSLDRALTFRQLRERSEEVHRIQQTFVHEDICDSNVGVESLWAASEPEVALSRTSASPRTPPTIDIRPRGQTPSSSLSGQTPQVNTPVDQPLFIFKPSDPDYRDLRTPEELPFVLEAITAAAKVQKPANRDFRRDERCQTPSSSPPRINSMERSFGPMEKAIETFRPATLSTPNSPTCYVPLGDFLNETDNACLEGECPPLPLDPSQWDVPCNTVTLTRKKWEKTGMSKEFEEKLSRQHTLLNLKGGPIAEEDSTYFSMEMDVEDDDEDDDDEDLLPMAVEPLPDKVSTGAKSLQPVGGFSNGLNARPAALSSKFNRISNLSISCVASLCPDSNTDASMAAETPVRFAGAGLRELRARVCSPGSSRRMSRKCTRNTTAKQSEFSWARTNPCPSSVPTHGPMERCVMEFDVVKWVEGTYDDGHDGLF